MERHRYVCKHATDLMRAPDLVVLISGSIKASLSLSPSACTYVLLGMNRPACTEYVLHNASLGARNGRNHIPEQDGAQPVAQS